MAISSVFGSGVQALGNGVDSLQRHARTIAGAGSGQAQVSQQPANQGPIPLNTSAISDQRLAATVGLLEDRQQVAVAAKVVAAADRVLGALLDEAR